MKSKKNQKEANYYVGKKGYTDVLSNEMRGGLLTRYPLNITRSYENMCIGEADGRPGVYYISDDNEAIKSNDFYEDKHGRYVIEPLLEQVEVRFERKVEARKSFRIQEAKRVEQELVRVEEAKARQEEKDEEARLLDIWNNTYDDLLSVIKKEGEGKTMAQQMKNKKIIAAVNSLSIMNYIKP